MLTDVGGSVAASEIGRFIRGSGGYDRRTLRWERRSIEIRIWRDVVIIGGVWRTIGARRSG